MGNQRRSGAHALVPLIGWLASTSCALGVDTVADPMADGAMPVVDMAAAAETGAPPPDAPSPTLDVSTPTDLAQPVDAGSSPAIDVPAIDAPAVDVPAVDAPAVDVPAVDVPAVDVPAIDVPAVDVPAIDVPTVTDRLVPADVPVAPDRPATRDTPAVIDVSPPMDVSVPCPAGQTRCADRCVSTTSDPEHCGACGLRCPVRARATAVCGASRCGVLCEPGYSDCDGDLVTGCEAQVATDLRHCGACGRACAAPNGTPICRAGACAVASCAAGFGNCNSVATDGCEANLSSDEAHCGACGRQCAPTQMCVASVCRSAELENFESASWPVAPWVSSGGTGDYMSSTTCAHDGARGLMAPSASSRWYYRTDVTVGAAGQRLSIWGRANTMSSRVYLGFGASAAGAWSLVLAANTRQLIFMSNARFSFTNVTVVTASLATGVWYRLEVLFNGGTSVTGTVYSAAGASVATLTTSLPGLTTGGVAFDAFGACVDSLRVQ